MSKALGWTAILIGLGMVAVAGLAYQLGMDNDPGWGRGRVMLLALGLACLTGGGLLWQWRRVAPLAARMDQRLSAEYQRLAHSQPAGWMQQMTRLPLLATRERQARLAAVLAGGFVLLGLVWYFSAGWMTRFFPYPHTYYDRQAQAFLRGQLHLPDEPDARLLQLDNPYDFASREGIPLLWDVSFYQGRFYLYWGATPALLLALVKMVIRRVIEDQALVIAFSLGIGWLLVWTGYRLWRQADRRISPAYLLFVLPAIGLNFYLVWSSGRPGVYEAAVLGGQFFLLLGLLALTRWGTARPPAAGWLGLAGAACALAFGSRPTLVLSAGWLLVMVAWRSAALGGGKRGWLAGTIAAFGAPLVLGGALLMIYNAARFGNPLESGLAYQLSIPAYPPDPAWTFSPAYLLPNAYNYLLRPPVFEPSFPFVSLPFIPETGIPSIIRVPAHYIFHESQVGSLAVFPLLGVIPFGCLALALALRRDARPAGLRAALAGWAASPQRWMLVSLLGCGLLQGLVILFYFFSALRFQLDSALLLALAGWLVILWFDGALAARPWLAALFRLLIVGVALYGLLIALLAGFGAGEQRFEHNNPLLFNLLAGWFESWRMR
ncbi:MAG: hypothetical protein AB1453_01675 [Chloroflexota bacterium]|jgi:hypothetical protein